MPSQLRDWSSVTNHDGDDHENALKKFFYDQNSSSECASHFSPSRFFDAHCADYDLKV